MHVTILMLTSGKILRNLRYKFLALLVKQRKGSMVGHNAEYKKALFGAHTVKLYFVHLKYILYSGSFSPCDVAVVAKILFISFLCSPTNNKLCDHKEMRYYSPGCGTQDPCIEYHFV